MQLSDILFRLGIYRIYQCHDYVFTTVTLACQDPELLQALSRRLYPAAAVQCQCTPIAVSRGIRMPPMKIQKEQMQKRLMTIIPPTATPFWW